MSIPRCSGGAGRPPNGSLVASRTMAHNGPHAAILSEIGFPPGLANALFLLSRSVGMMAHAHEERTRMPPRRYIHPTEWECDGPPRPATSRGERSAVSYRLPGRGSSVRICGPHPDPFPGGEGEYPAPRTQGSGPDGVGGTSPIRAKRSVSRP